jgi:5-(carboxyamino)imidazole ribonucleotide mutase
MADKTKPQVGIIMGSDSDLSVMAEAAETLKQFGVACEVDVTSAHRSPARTSEYARMAAQRGLKAIIVGAGGAAHLAGVVAAETTLPVIAVPMPSTTLQGLDSLLATVQMPAGVPVACMAIGRAGATNAAIFAVQILAASDPALAKKMAEHKEKLARSVAEKSKKVKREFKKS